MSTPRGSTSLQELSYQGVGTGPGEKVKEGLLCTCKVAQEFDSSVVLDFESTCWENGARMGGLQEIIEFPAVLLGTTTGGIMSESHQYIMPVEQLILSEFCKNLTGNNSRTG
ncbi:ERI1 exoribonuclease 2-like [Macrobrachium rosenbergii]|uniref:ERI1 exoribonuclease 2-like n=1 Tax=Macrobrachium rosenbergii TaxID=79674 RepID=UPI0034D4F81D